MNTPNLLPQHPQSSAVSMSMSGSLSRVEEYPWSKSQDEEEGIVDRWAISRRKNFVDSSRMSFSGNVLRGTRSIREYEAHLRMVPSHLPDNVRLFTNSSLESPKAGLLYMQEHCFYKRGKTEYALSVNHDIYRQMMTEVNDANRIPLSLYFCCHGGDGAHSGVVHGDFVDIRVAVCILGVLFIIFLLLVFCIPWPEGGDDDFFN